MSSIQHEYYIRQPDDTEARGPFTLAQLASLADTGGLDSRTLFFEAGSEQWLPVAGSGELGVLLRGATARATGTGSTRHLGDARVLLFAGATVFLLVAVVPMLNGGGIQALLSQPFFWVGVIDVILGACAAVLAGRFVLVIRPRAALGLGFLGALCWFAGSIPALALVVIASACLWLATVLSGRRALLINAIAGLAALAGFAYCVLS